MDEIRRGALEIIPEDELVRKLERSLETGTPLVVKQGFDPTRPDLHIGHAVSIRKLRTFQELGHTVVFVVGDYTARVGDPTGRSETRPTLSPADIESNARTYADQVGRILDAKGVLLEYNSRWLAPLTLADILQLTAAYTVARMLERDDFAKRLAENRPISMMELMYPLMQAYDSVALNADVELGGTDQKFNLLVARTIQERYGQDPQVCLIMPLLRGTDGEQKMSKSYDNYIGISEPPEEMYGKTMSIPDTLLEEWYDLASGLAGEELEAAKRRLAGSPYEAKRELAALITGTYHGTGGVEAGRGHFDRVFREGGEPEDMPEIVLSVTDPGLRYADGAVWGAGLLVAAGLATSNSEAVRLIEQGAVSVDGTAVEGRNTTIPLEPGRPVVLRRGKRRFTRVRLER
ncbi:MAG TPA: tyrosine--tRNA ligase [Longimicrobiales bacterium]|nr:tyrosine--tRNA ligase [Longimicrobiales bacterium]